MSKCTPGPWVVLGKEYAATFVLEDAAKNYVKGSRGADQVIVPFNVARVAPEMADLLKRAAPQLVGPVASDVRAILERINR